MSVNGFSKIWSTFTTSFINPLYFLRTFYDRETNQYISFRTGQFDKLSNIDVETKQKFHSQVTKYQSQLAAMYVLLKIINLFGILLLALAPLATIIITPFAAQIWIYSIKGSILDISKVNIIASYVLMVIIFFCLLYITFVVTPIKSTKIALGWPIFIIFSSLISLYFITLNADRQINTLIYAVLLALVGEMLFGLALFIIFTTFSIIDV